jgi:hypothetical protein
VCPWTVIPQSKFAMLVPDLTVDPFVDNALVPSSSLGSQFEMTSRARLFGSQITRCECVWDVTAMSVKRCRAPCRGNGLGEIQGDMAPLPRIPYSLLDRSA